MHCIHLAFFPYVTGKVCLAHTKQKCAHIQDQICEFKNRIIALNTPINRAAFCLIIILSTFFSFIGWLIHVTTKPYELYPPELIEHLNGACNEYENWKYKYEVTQQFGKGPFSCVAIIARTHVETQETTRFAVKIIPENAVPRPGLSYWFNPLNWLVSKRKVKQVFRNEASALKALSVNPFMAGYAEARKARNTAYFFLNIPQGDTLASILATSGGKISDHVFLHLAVELSCTIDYLHTRGLTCGELSPESIFVGNDGHIYFMNSDLLTIDTAPYFVLHGDTPFATKMENRKDFGQDWCNLGLLLLQLKTGAQPYTDGNGQVHRRTIESLYHMRDQRAASLINGLLNRHLFGEPLRKHEIFTGVEWDVALRKGYMSPLFMAHDLENANGLFTLDHIENDKEMDDIVRYLQGIGRYKIYSL